MAKQQKGFRQVMANDEVERHKVLFLLSGIASIEDSFSIDDVEYSWFDQSDVRDLTTELTRHSVEQQSQYDARAKRSREEIEAGHKRIAESFLNQPVAKYEVRCVWDEAVNSARDRVVRANSILTLCAIAHYHKADVYAVRLASENERLHLKSSIVSLSQGSWTFQTMTTAEIAGTELGVDHGFLQTLNDSHFSALTAQLMTDPLTNFSSQLSQALSCVINGYKSKKGYEKLMGYILALEMLFARSRETSKTSAIAEGVALFTTSELDERMKARSRIAKLYRKRGNFVHDGKWEFEANDLTYLLKSALNSILNISITCKDIKTVDDFGSFITKTKLSN